MDPGFPFATSSQTIGPYYRVGLHWEGGNVLAGERTRGERITLSGQIVDGNGEPVTDALIEVWQANAAGKYDHPDDLQDKPIDPHFSGFGRLVPDAEGRFELLTIKPGAVEGPEGIEQAPHLSLLVFARGLLRHLVTRVYFADEPDANAADPVLSQVEESRRGTLLARKDSGAQGRYSWNLVLQGRDETVFFDC